MKKFFSSNVLNTIKTKTHKVFPIRMNLKMKAQSKNFGECDRNKKKKKKKSNKTKKKKKGRFI